MKIEINGKRILHGTIILFMLILTLMFATSVTAVSYNDTHGRPLGLSASASVKNGMCVEALRNATLRYIQAGPNFGGSTIRLTDGALSDLQVNSSPSSQGAGFNYNLTTGNYYCFVAWKGGASFGFDYNLSTGNVTTSSLIWYTDVYGTVQEPMGATRSIVRVTLENETVSTPPENATLQAQNQYATTLLNYNATILGTVYTPNATGIIILPMNTDNTSLFNITYQATGHNNRTYNNINLSTRHTAELLNTTTVYFTINVWDNWTTSLIPDLTIRINNTANYSSNPYSEDISNYLTWSNETYNLSVTVWDNDLLHRPYESNITLNNSILQYNITMLANQLLLFFYENFNDTTKTVSGYISDLTKRRDFNATSVLIYQQNLSTGRVNVRIGTLDATGDNWTQYYEYNNDRDTQINESIEILQNRDFFIYVDVRDYNNRPIEDATVRVLWADYSLNAWKTGKLLGQRLTNADGKTLFYGDDGSELFFTVTADNYQTVYIPISLSDESYTRSDSLVIYMRDLLSATEISAITIINSPIYTKNNNLNGTITYHGTQQVSINTQYRINQGLSNITIQKDILGRYDFTLISGTDFSSLTPDNITLYTYTNTTLANTKTIIYDNATKKDLLTPINGLPTNLTNFLLFAVAVIIASVLGLSMPDQSGVGKNTFMIMCIIIGAISTSFMWLTVIGTIYYALRGIRTIISE